MNISNHGSGVLRDYYNCLLKERGLSETVARHALARRIAVLAYGVMKTGKKFSPEMLKCNTN